MKTACLLFLGLLLSACSSPWTRGDTYRQSAVIGLMAVDHHQTREIAAHPEKWEEYNPILGRHPSEGKVDAYFLSLAAGHTAIAAVLPRKWRSFWQYLYIGAEGICVVHNFGEGIR
jgi:hypothetical protein